MESFAAVLMCKSEPKFGAFREPVENEIDTGQKKSCGNSLTTFAKESYSAARMKKRKYTAAEVIHMLKAQQGNKRDAEYAREIGIDQSYLCDLYKGRRQPGPAILCRFGLVKRQPEPFYEVA